MEGIITINGAAVDNGHNAVSGEILWQEGRILGYIILKREFLSSVRGCKCALALSMRTLKACKNVLRQDTDCVLGWAKFIEWKHPVEIVFTNPTQHKLTEAVEAAATL
jgi:hypothetical protein